MIEIDIPKDLESFQPRFVGPFTVRNLKGIVPAFALGVPTFIKVNEYFITDISIAVMILVAAPFIAYGFISPYQMPFEHFAKLLFRNYFKAPKKRSYKINTPYEECVYITPQKRTSKKSNKKRNNSLKKNKNTITVTDEDLFFIT